MPSATHTLIAFFFVFRREMIPFPLPVGATLKSFEDVMFRQLAEYRVDLRKKKISHVLSSHGFRGAEPRSKGNHSQGEFFTW